MLVDEVGFPLAYEKVLFTDTTLGTTLGGSTTNSEGNFYLDYSISVQSQLGIHIIQIQFDGDPTNYYKPAINAPTVFFTVRPPLTVIMDDSLTADSWTTIQVIGGLNEQVTLSWQPEFEIEWFEIGVVQLNSTGGGQYNWFTPTYKGIFTLRVEGSATTKYDAATMYVIPHLSINGTLLHYVNQPYFFSVNASEKYQVWIDGDLWASSGSSGVHRYDYTFSTRGQKEILIVSEDTFVLLTEYTFEVRVFDPVIITIDVPSITDLNVGVNIDGKIEGLSSGLIEGIDAYLEINGTVEQVDATGIGGYFHFVHYFDQAGYYFIRVFSHEDSINYYNASTSSTTRLFVQPPPPKIDSISPQNQTTYGSEVLINFSCLEATIYYYIAPLDSFNTTWNASYIRQLEEGEYVCHVYGTDKFNITVHITILFYVDATPPQLTIHSPASTHTYVSDKVLLNFSTDADTFDIYLDSRLQSGVHSGSDLFISSSGEYNLTIIAKDLVGNKITKTVIFTVKLQGTSFTPNDQSSQPVNPANETLPELTLGLLSLFGIIIASGVLKKIKVRM
jgi:hypothetical protein